MQLSFDLKGGPVEQGKKLAPAVRGPAPAASAPAEVAIREPEVFSVAALTRKIRDLLESGVGEVWVEGEVSNVRRQASGHVYFTLKDATSQLACVMFASQASQLRGIAFADGAQVQVFGQVTVYEARGNYQIIVRKVQARGVGALQAKFEELKRRLSAEGLFDRKRPLPKFPRRVGVVTSPTGAAIRDFLQILRRRQKGIEVVIYPVRVQGKGAAAEIAEAVRFFGEPVGIEAVDVIVVTRGGGSLEDLWEFNEEAVARAIAASPVPVVSAVGHEIDFTIADFVADLRAPTPSAAAEILSADAEELLDRLGQVAMRLRRAVRSRLEAAGERVAGFRRTALFSEPQRLVLKFRQDLDRAADDLGQGMVAAVQARRLLLERASGVLAANSPARKMSEAQARLEQARRTMAQCAARSLAAARADVARNAAVLGALSPTASLARGYTLTLAADGSLIRSAKAVVAGQPLVTRFADGSVASVASDPSDPSDPSSARGAA